MSAPMRIYVLVMDGKPFSSWHYSTSPYAPEKDLEYIRADIHEAEIDALKAENANLEFLLQHVIGDHCAPNDCYATGPLTGNPIADLVSCPSCAALDYLASKEKK